MAGYSKIYLEAAVRELDRKISHTLGGLKAIILETYGSCVWFSTAKPWNTGFIVYHAWRSDFEWSRMQLAYWIGLTCLSGSAEHLYERRKWQYCSLSLYYIWWLTLKFLGSSRLGVYCIAVSFAEKKVALTHSHRNNAMNSTRWKEPIEKPLAAKIVPP